MTLAHRTPMLTHQNKYDLPHCSAYMISQDLSHISIVPVSCTAKYWNRILCESESNKTQNHESSDANKGKGQYAVHNSTLFGSTLMCPHDYNIAIYGMCMKLTLLQDNMLRHNNTYNIMSIYNYTICRNSKSFAEIHTNVTSDVSLIHEILDEFYAKGSELFLDHQPIDPDQYVWFAPPLYPTYMPCLVESRHTRKYPKKYGCTHV